MKIASFAVGNRHSYGAIKGNRVVEISARAKHATLCEAIADGTILDAGHKAEIPSGLSLADVTLLTPITNPNKIICIGLNYRGHAAEAGQKAPEFPSLFLRLTNSVVASGAPLVCPRLSSDFDYEGELAIVIGKGGRYIDREKALDHVFGYSCFNDGSIRDFQFKHSLTAGKNFLSTGGFGPWIVTADEISDPSKLTLTTRLNGERVQQKGIDDLIFDVPSIVSYVSSWTELTPGDVIATGTPEGVGFARKPPIWLKPGDVVEVEISNIGILRNPVVSE